MASPILDTQQLWLAGEKKNLAIKVWDENDPSTDLSTATATFAIKDNEGTVVLAAGAATVTGTTVIRITRLWDSTGVDPGFYRAVCTVTFGAIVQIFQFTLEMRPNPSPS
jgi:hypothetical protein